MKDDSELLRLEYARSLAAYVKTCDEAALSSAYEIGRRAMVEGTGILELARVHGDSARALVGSSPPGERERRAEAAAEFFFELLSPLEMSLRGYRQANEELRRVNETLIEQKAAVEIANRELESFSYSVSHDLRAPLRRIEGFSQILLEDYAAALGEAGRAHLVRVREGVEQMAQLIEDLLGLARVSRSEIFRADVDLTAMARRICERLRAGASKRDGSFLIADGVRARCDALLVAILLENLLGNAWKFTSRRPHAEIAFGSEMRDGMVVYFVRDNGAGFDMSHAGKLFSPFHRLHSAAEFEGTGIGLATVQRVVHRHGGRVWAEARVDHGAVFYFSLGSAA